MFEEACEACGSPLIKKSAWVSACQHCGFQLSNLKPAPGTGIQGLESLRRENFEVILNHIGKIKHLNETKLLEVGSAWGWFLEAALKRGTAAKGIEPEKENADLSRSKGLDVEDGFFPHDLNDRGPYDVIVFNDVFEHIPSPSTAIKQVESLLATKGIVVLNYPSTYGFFFKTASLLSIMGVHGPLERLWQKGMPSPHVSYFNPKAMQKLVSQHTGLKHITTFRLKSVSRKGLRQRISASHPGLKGILMVSIIWIITIILPILPSDIEVSIFEKVD